MIRSKLLNLILLCLVALVTHSTAHAQQAALKTNVLYGVGTLTPNLGFEVSLGERSTLNITGSYNPWNRNGSVDNNKKFVHWLGNMEYRWWTCERFNGHFFGAHILGSQYNVGGHKIPLLFDRKYRNEGWAAGMGVSYGYHWMLSPRWGLEFTIGAGYARMEYDKYDCEKCGKKASSHIKHYFGPTKAGISLVFII